MSYDIRPNDPSYDNGPEIERMAEEMGYVYLGPGMYFVRPTIEFDTPTAAMSHVHEVSVTTRDAKGGTHTVEAEIKAQSSECKGAANEVLEEFAKNRGKDAVRYVETGR